MAWPTLGQQTNKGSVVWGFDMKGNWDSTTENVTPGTTNYGDGFLIVHDCDASGFMAAFGCTGETAINKVVVSQSTVTNWQDYGIFIGSANGNEAWLLGVKITQHVDALSGGRGKISGAGYAGNDHGPLRCQSQHLVMECVETFSRNAWTAADKADDQDGMRLHMNGAARTICANRILCEGGLKAYADGAAASSDKNGMNIRITNLIHLGNYVSSVGVDISNGGTTLENPLLIRSDNPVATGTQTNGNAVIIYGATSPETNLNENNESPVRVRNLTAINLTSDENTLNKFKQYVTFNPVSAPGNFADVEVYDSAEYTVRTNSAHDDGPFDLVALREPLYKGQRFGYEYVETTLSADIGDGGSFFINYPAGTAQSDYFDGWSQISGGGIGTYNTKPRPPSASGDSQGRMEIVFGATQIEVINRTRVTGSNDPKNDRAEVVWANGSVAKLKLDRRFSPPEFTQPTPAGSYHLYHPTSGNAALVGGATGSVVPRRDLLMRVRSKTPSRGALEPI